MVSYGVIYDSNGRLVEPTCSIILTEHQGVMRSHNEVLSIRQEAERRQRYGSNQPLDIAYLRGEPYNFRISEDDIAMTLRALSSKCLNSQQHRMIEGIQSMFKSNWCCQTGAAKRTKLCASSSCSGNLWKDTLDAGGLASAVNIRF